MTKNGFLVLKMINLSHPMISYKRDKLLSWRCLAMCTMWWGDNKWDRFNKLLVIIWCKKS